MTYFIVYKTTNLKNGKVYIGQHKTDDLDDGYLGSGKLIIQAINKHGPSSFSREILYHCDSEEEMNAKELEIVNEEFISREDTYNMVIGGTGGCKMSKERTRENSRNIMTQIHKDGKLDDHYKKLGELNSERLLGSKNPDHSERLKRDWEENPRVWWNNGKSELRAITCPGPKYVQGRLTNNSEALKENHKMFPKYWWNNGEKNTRATECPGSGWVRGKLQVSEKFINENVSTNSKSSV